MTTAHRPTFDPAQGKEALRGPAYHQRLLPAYMHLKTRQPGQGGEADGPRDLRAELLAAEAAHFAKTKGVTDEARTEPVPKTKRDLEDDAEANLDAEDIEAKRRRILEETRDIDADSIGSESDSSEEESDDEEDEAAELMRELEKIKRERQEQKEKEEREREAQEQEQREYDIARGNPLLNPQDFNMKRRWDDDVVFKNQARGSEVKRGPEFVNVENPDNAYTAVGAYNLNVEATALVRAAEDLLSLTRFMKEAWLFEKLNTVGEDEHDTRRNQKLEEDVAAVKEAVQKGLLGDNDVNGEKK
ncbi:uncharacterized protein BHQ10_007109 [Talaromyces amestolkiae]|uniref:Pre-mRNA-splicing factor cwc15 n=1 Tax=Talaromyces amestolkiae TaxID=1196081 RepID=A0A364L5K5_TALAM|nr:uncharacterized protein BHQ10_007109 [Talaromyces amestolkiae]RAO71097.1 hypothetical protein BHQ10_007109 [Talaromyces amestolkiae]